MSEETKETPKPKKTAGKGDSPRNISERFRKNYDLINWGHKKNERGKKRSCQ